MFNAGKTRMIGLPYGEKTYDDMLSRFHLVPERNGQTDGQTDRQTDRFAISISRVAIKIKITHCTAYHRLRDPSTTGSESPRLRFDVCALTLCALQIVFTITNISK